MDEDTMVMDERKSTLIAVEEIKYFSEYLDREVLIDIYKPINIDKNTEVPLLLINDGQDLRKMEFNRIVHPLISSGVVKPIISVAIHCGHDRLNEYGTMYMTDYKGRGNKAGRYNKFLFDELLPYIRLKYSYITFSEMSFAGFSLGGLNAIDNVWNYANHFSKVGVFSGALWWRRNGYDNPYYNPETDRIMHLQVMKGKMKPHLKFFFECGQLDETADRNNNGIIDSIDDATDLITHLKDLGYADQNIRYLELEDGGHDVETWARSFPEFLRWGWGTEAV